MKVNLSNIIIFFVILLLPAVCFSSEVLFQKGKMSPISVEMYLCPSKYIIDNIINYHKVWGMDKADVLIAVYAEKKICRMYRNVYILLEESYNIESLDFDGKIHLVAIVRVLLDGVHYYGTFRAEDLGIIEA